MATLLVFASLLPLVVAAYLEVQQTRQRLVDDMGELLQARGEQVVRDVDGFHAGHQRAVGRIARFPDVAGYCAADAAGRAARHADLLGLLAAFPGSDSSIGGAAVVGPDGRILVATNAAVVGLDISFRPHVRAALAGQPAVSDIHLSVTQAGEQAQIAYLAPVRAGGDRGEVLCAALLITRAQALWDLLRGSNGRAGPGSYAVAFDRLGIRVAHSHSDSVVFRPGGRLDPATIESLVAERRFGMGTRQFLDDVQPYPEQFERARADALDATLFRGFSPVNRSWTYGVALRASTVPWTVFYMVPATNLESLIAQTMRQQVALAAAIIALALIVGLVFAASIVRPVRALTAASEAIGRGDLSTRVGGVGEDELGQLGQTFNAMAERIEHQARALEGARDEMQQRVVERTAELSATAERLSAEVAERKQAQLRLQAQLARLNLLDQVTCAIGERQDLQSIYQVTIRSLEERLPADFCCICRYDAAEAQLTVTRVGVHSAALALEMAMTESALVPIDRNGLSRCVRGHLVYEEDIGQTRFPFPQRLASGGLRSLVIAPLQSESRVFGVMVVARREPHAFSSGDCEFLRQLSAHVALAARQAELHSSLQRAYDDLRQTQQAVMQQERLRALGQMASGIAHDINNAISPVVLYTESLLEHEPNLSPQARSYLENIARAVDDVAATVQRMREFYRQRTPQLALTGLSPNKLVREVAEMTRARWSDMPQQRGIVIRLSTDLADDVPEIAGVESEVREALINLVFNAVDAMPDGGELTLRTRRVTDAQGAPAARIDVADTGIGMDEQTRRRCLEPFFTTKGERGTGLGLAMVYGAAQRHGAQVDIDSEPGRGTTVMLRFPPPSEATTNAVAGAEAPARSQRLRILLVDDDPLLLKTLQDMLERDGHVVVAANDGQAGIDAFEASTRSGEAFSLVLTDLGMPYVDGRKVADAVKRASPSTPVVLLTGWGQGLLGDDETLPHVDEVLSKPPKLADLRRALLRHGGRPQPSVAPAGAMATQQG
ncbi:ATP-binding protein [Caldimonas sp. KR1-144]|uniref:ATP-binding protein n=1 Tax=Caldimonas sp. KR1-144 TaxID=3400911 RepID=UPI003C02BEEA